MDQVLGDRRKYRFSVKHLSLSINGKTYRIFNINEYGMGFLIDSSETIEIGTEIKPVFDNGNMAVQVTGIPQHISQFCPSHERLFFKPGWVCGTEFTTRHDKNGWKLFREFIAENIGDNVEETEE